MMRRVGGSVLRSWLSRRCRTVEQCSTVLQLVGNTLKFKTFSYIPMLKHRNNKNKNCKPSDFDRSPVVMVHVRVVLCPLELLIPMIWASAVREAFFSPSNFTKHGPVAQNHRDVDPEREASRMSVHSFVLACTPLAGKCVTTSHHDFIKCHVLVANWFLNSRRADVNATGWRPSPNVQVDTPARVDLRYNIVACRCRQVLRSQTFDGC